MNAPGVLSEAQWQTLVLELASTYGWLAYHTHDSRRSHPGWPDLVLVHRARGRALFLELKTDTGRPTAAQLTWLWSLRAARLEVAVLRPCDLPFLRDVLGPRNAGLPDSPELAA